MNLDYYKILGVDKNASSDEIKKAYKKLAIKYHPDKNEGDELSTEIFKKVKEAYENLFDVNKKAIYDRKKSGFSSKQTSTPHPKYQKQYKSRQSNSNSGMSNRKASFIAFGFMVVFTSLIYFIYPKMNQWASNDKLNSAQEMADSENWTEAYVYSSAAIDQWDENGKAYLLRAKITSGIYKKYGESLSDFNQAFKHLPEDSITGADYYMRAKCNHELGRLEKACNDLKTSLNKGFQRAADDISVICQ